MLLRQLPFCAFVFALSGPAHGALPKGPRLQLSPAWTPVGPPLEGGRGYSARYVRQDEELDIKGTKISDPAAAATMVTVNLANIAGLYAPRGNPYVGQISSLIKCSPRYKPRRLQFKAAGVHAEALAAGLNARNQFGACTRQEIAHWGIYTSFYHPPSAMVIEARLRRRSDAPAPEVTARLTRELADTLKALFADESQ